MKTNLPLISIIIPVHNAGSFLDECLQSVIDQTYKNLEIITVDDDSTDESKKIIEKHQEQDKRIKYFHVSNHNAAKTRQTGVSRSKTEYICFVDADDIVSEKYIDTLYLTMQKTGVKIASGKIASIASHHDIKDVTGGTGKIWTEDDLLAYFGNNYHASQHNGFNGHIPQSINAKLFKKDVFDGIDYSVLKTSILEDNYIISQILKKVSPQKIALVDSTIYYYRRNPNSTMSGALNHIVKYGNKEISYPRLFDITMEYINDLYHKSKNVEFYTNKIKVEEYYTIAEAVVDKNIHINNLNKYIEDLDIRQKQLNKEIENILNSKSYKLGHTMLSPIRKLKKIFRR